jgi:rhomboid protease GluP
VGVNDDRCYTCGRANPGLWGFAPLLRQLGNDTGFVPFVIGACGVLYVLTLAASGSNALGGGSLFNFLAPSGVAMLRFGASGGVPVLEAGRWWTVLSATWLHWNLLHIVLNMMGVRNLGPAIVDIVGPGRTVIIYVVSGACGFLLTSATSVLDLPIFSGASYTAGASASIFGLVGALVHYGRVSGSSYIRTEATRYAVIMFAYGLLFPRIDNFAHAGGFIGGYALSLWLNPLTRERGDHMIVAVLCLVASLAAIVASLVTSGV